MASSSSAVPFTVFCTPANELSQLIAAPAAAAPAAATAAEPLLSADPSFSCACPALEARSP